LRSYGIPCVSLFQERVQASELLVREACSVLGNAGPGSVRQVPLHDMRLIAFVSGIRLKLAKVPARKFVWIDPGPDRKKVVAKASSPGRSAIRGRQRLGTMALTVCGARSQEEWRNSHGRRSRAPRLIFLIRVDENQEVHVKKDQRMSVCRESHHVSPPLTTDKEINFSSCQRLAALKSETRTRIDDAFDCHTPATWCNSLLPLDIVNQNSPYNPQAFPLAPFAYHNLSCRRKNKAPISSPCLAPLFSPP